MDRPGGENELDKLRKTIEEFRAKAERNGMSCTQAGPGNVFVESKSANATPEMGYPSSDPGHWGTQSAYSAPALTQGRHYDTLSPNSTIGKRVSSGSLSSMSSHASHSSVSSASSGSSADSEQRHMKKKRWLPLKSAFSRGSKTSQSSDHHEFLDADDSGCLLSPTSSRREFHHNSSVSSFEGAPIDHQAYNEILQILQEKERKLTDVRLEALTSQHHLHQLQDQIAQMQHEMQLLRLENERLQACNGNYVQPTSVSAHKLSLDLPSISPFAISSELELDASPNSLKSFDTGVSGLDCCNLHRLVSPGSEDEGLQIRFLVTSPSPPSSPTQQHNPEDILIGSLPVSRKSSWEGLDRMVSDLFTEYCRCVDGDSRLGLTSSSIAFYKVGEQTRVSGSQPPDLLPCAYIVGNVDSVAISLRDATCGSVDLLAFKTLIPKDILLRYVNSVLQKKKIILHGPSGTGKSFLSYSLAYHFLSRDRKSIKKQGGLYVHDVKQKGKEDLKTYIKDLSQKYKNPVPGLTPPSVIIVENCQALKSFNETFAPLSELPQDAKSPYVIATMLQGKAHTDEESRKHFSWITCSNNSMHVRDYLSRCLRRSVVENEIKNNQTSEDEFQNMLRVITWLPLCWHHVNRCLEGQSAGDVTIGPRVFASCPTNFYASCSWFVQVWNHVIAPYVIAAIRRIRQSQSKKDGDDSNPKWTDPTQWVMESFPWNVSDMGCDHTLRLKHITSDELDCPPVPPRTDQPPSRNQIPKEPPRPNYPSHTMTMNNPNSIDTCVIGHTSSASVKRQNSKKCVKEIRDPPVPPMELMGIRDQGSTVWHRHNSPMASPTKTVIHAGVGSNIH
ncbi:neuron navigator 3-like [Clavelina lepadiformis]|uniref:neuron navigator 3-like n=1 Tax=Clavelina lepadiformis TaxID=159417 RepID=UPI004040F9F0